MSRKSYLIISILFTITLNFLLLFLSIKTKEISNYYYLIQSDFGKTTNTIDDKTSQLENYKYNNNLEQQLIFNILSEHHASFYDFHKNSLGFEFELIISSTKDYYVSFTYLEIEGNYKLKEIKGMKDIMKKYLELSSDFKLISLK